MHTVPISAVKMADGFWAKRIKVTRKPPFPFTYRQMEDHGRFDNPFPSWMGKARSLRAGFHTAILPVCGPAAIRRLTSA